MFRLFEHRTMAWKQWLLDMNSIETIAAAETRFTHLARTEL